MNSVECLNCFSPILPAQRFCSDCGQKTDTHRLTMGHIGHDVLHAFTHTDKGMFHLIKALAINPGTVAREYVEGARKKYFNPFSFLILVTAIATILASSFNLVTGSTRKDPVSVFLDKHYNLLIFLNTPIIAFFSWLLFRKSRKNFAEFLVMAAYATGERTVFFALIVVPLHIIFPHNHIPLTYANLIVWAFYLAWTTTVFARENKVWGWVKSLIASALVHVIIYMLIFAVYAVYYRNYSPR
ncbi:MAG: DUF3667 domain-containing protein [Gemmatimonadaceae bacterium]|nr:DUF3667 domain-containing protein [Chitinophagaceae bacterium]